ncbi:MAG: RNA polymerase sigma-54 factor, partial [Bacteroidetes bacterium]|nr:RNA polymerase sigma-54 factor [Bacteroidota bacterium]
MLQLSQQQKLQLKLSPQQIQYIRLLQLPQLALEQAIKAELEVNPALEEGGEDDVDTSEEGEQADVEAQADPPKETAEKEEKPETDDSWLLEDAGAAKSSNDDEFSWEDYISTEDLYGYKTEDYYSNYSDDDDRPDFTPVHVSNFTEKIRDQIRLLNFNEKQIMISEHLLGSVDPDGYLRVEPAKFIDDFIFN